jgi:hypothetical protein
MPRISVTVTDEEAEIIRRTADALGQSQSAVVQDIIRVQVPVLRRILPTCEKLAAVRTARRASSGEPAPVIVIGEDTDSRLLDGFKRFLALLGSSDSGEGHGSPSTPLL